MPAKVIRIDPLSYFFIGAVLIDCSDTHAHFMFPDCSEAYMTYDQLRKVMEKSSWVAEYIGCMQFPKAFVNAES